MSKDVKNPTWEELSREFSQSYTKRLSEINKYLNKEKKIFDPLVGRYFQSETAFFKVLSILSVDSAVLDVLVLHCKMNMNQPAIDVRPQGIYLEGRMIELTKEEFTERINERIDVLKQVINQ